jgi:hypothetical protein
MNSPTQRTLALLRAQGWTCAVVERWNQYAGIRQDVFGFGDILAYHEREHSIALFQACAGASHANRLAKLMAEPRVQGWLQAGGRVAVISWRKAGARGQRKTWTERIEWIVPNAPNQARSEAE